MGSLLEQHNQVCFQSQFFPQKKVYNNINHIFQSWLHYNNLFVLMYRFAMKFIKIGVPLGLSLHQINRIYNKQQSEEQKGQNFNYFIQSKHMTENLIINKSEDNSEKHEQEDNLGQNKKQNEQERGNSQQRNQQNNKASEQILKTIPSSKKNQNNEQLKNNQVIVGPSTPQIIIDYFKMNGVSIRLDQNLVDNKIKVKNNDGDTLTIQSDQFLLPNTFAFFRCSNFLSPLNQIKSFEQMKPLFKNLANDELIIATFIPEQQQYIKAKLSKSQYDTFSSMKMIDIKKIQKQFRQEKYDQGSAKSSYILIRDPQIARQMKMNVNKIGDKYVFYKTTQKSGMEASALIQGFKYTIKTLPLENKTDKTKIQVNKFNYLNVINIGEDANNLIRSINSKKTSSKILLIYSRQKRSDFINEVKSIALKVGKIMKQQVTIVMTQNQKILTDYFQVIPDDFVTLRIIDINKYQAPLLTLAGFNKKMKNFYSRKVMSGPFSVENVCHFIKNSNNLQEYYQKKRLGSIPSIVSQNEGIDDNTLILHWKHGCKGCQLTNDYLQQIKRIFRSLDQSKRFKYEIENYEQVKKIEFRKMNILNQQQQKNKEGHDSTPKLILKTKGKMKDLQIGAILGKLSTINTKNEKKVHEQIIKEIISCIEENLQN